jgi:hypothetical protein
MIKMEDKKEEEKKARSTAMGGPAGWDACTTCYIPLVALMQQPVSPPLLAHVALF